MVLFIGVNGVGKTTTIGKIGYQLRRERKKVLFCAADTFRAAAADQLTIWADRAGVEIVKQHEGADPAAVVFDAATAAKARNTDVMLVDTAGRLHNKQNLMNELNKISRVIDRELPGCARETLLVLDATTGQNGLGAERPHPGQAVQRGRRHHRHRPHQAGRHRQGGHRHRHRQGVGRARQVRRCGRGRGRPETL